MKPSSLESSLIENMRLAAKKAGSSLLEDFGRRAELRVDAKSPSDFVSEADTKSDAISRKILRAAFQDYGFLTEDGPKSDTEKPKRFIIDSLDGTTNFLKGLDEWCISIAAEVDKKIVAGVIYAPRLDKLYHAVKDGGAYLDTREGSRRLKVSTETDLGKAEIAVGLPSRGRPKPALADRCGMEVANIVSWRSVALECAGVAQGSLDGYIHLRHYGGPWDFAAGKLLVEEAGGIVLAPDGVSDPVYGDDIVCLTPSLGEKLWTLFLQTKPPLALTKKIQKAQMNKGPTQ